MNSGQETEERGKVRANSPSKSKLSEKARPLFVCGPDRSGTTAFADYLNQHQEILICQERYTAASLKKITSDHFTFDRILDFRPRETETPPDLFDLFTFERNLGFKPDKTKRSVWKKRELHVKYHTELLTRKDPAKLKWIGDKHPFYVRWMDMLAGNNPGARFMVLYRPIEEIAESWEARAKDPDDEPWDNDRGAEKAVETWNMALRKTREFIESSPAPRLLIISYHDFFYRNEAIVSLVSRFLGLEFDESVTRVWREASLEFESARRHKEPLSEEQRSFIEEHADRDAEAWVLERIEKQWREPGLYVEESTEAKRALLEEMEARAWRLKRHLEELQEQNRREVKKLSRTLARAQKENRNLAHQLRSIRASRSWRLMDKLGRLLVRVRGRK